MAFAAGAARGMFLAPARDPIIRCLKRSRFPSTPWGATPAPKWRSAEPRLRSIAGRICAFSSMARRRRCGRFCEANPRVRDKSVFHHCDVSVQMDDKPSQALRKGRWKSSMWRSIQAVRDREAGAAVSAGNTGALMAMAKFCLKPLPGIERPAIAAIWPTLRGESIVLDVGATIGADAQNARRLRGDGSRNGALRLRARSSDGRAPQRRCGGDQGRRGGSRGRRHPA